LFVVPQFQPQRLVVDETAGQDLAVRPEARSISSRLMKNSGRPVSKIRSPSTWPIAQFGKDVF
jgi:hypothetical protein